MASPEDEDLIFSKLDVLKDIRSKTIHLEKLKIRILQLMQAIRKEDGHLHEYKAEIEHLKREKMLHIESLRHIERDLNLMESTIVEAKQERERVREKTCSLLDEYTPLKIEIDTQRMQIGLAKLTELPGRELITLESVNNYKEFPSPTAATSQPLPQERCVPTHLYGTEVPSGSVSFLAMSDMRQNGRKQQKPPMKTCTSCQELIHRNAPVCPMCKAKSKSKNPKKPKRKLDSE